MKTLNFLFLIFLWGISSEATAQLYDFTVWESQQQINSITHSSIGVKIYETDPKTIEKAWVNELKRMGAKVKAKNEITATGCTLKDFSEMAFNVYSVVKPINDSISTLYTAVDLGGAYLSSGDQPGKYLVFSKLISGIASEITRKSINKQLEDAQKQLENNEKELSKLEKENKKMKDNIEKWKNQISETENAIIKNERDQINKSTAIIRSKKKVNFINGKLRRIQ